MTANRFVDTITLKKTTRGLDVIQNVYAFAAGNEMRNAFDTGLALIVKTGELAEINARYERRSAIREDRPRPAGCA